MMIRVTLFAALSLLLAGANAWADEPDGLILPPGFHADVVADGLTGARHIAIRDNGDIYVSTNAPRGAPPSGIIALHLDKDHKAVVTKSFSAVSGGTGLRFYKNALYAATATTLYRFALDADALIPSKEPETIIENMPGGSANRLLAFDGAGGLFVAVSGTGNNVCTDPASPKDKPAGFMPCPELATRAGVWRFDADKIGQQFSAGEHFATGSRNMTAFEWSPAANALYGIMHERDATHATWPNLVSASDDDNIGDTLYRISKGTDFGWPYTYYDGARNLRLVAPEYGGDAKAQAAPGLYATPLLSLYPVRGAPTDMVFYDGRQFPASYRGGLFVLRHGGVGAGYDILFVPSDGSGKFGKQQPFADGFAGPTAASKTPAAATYRPVGEAIGRDGSLYVVDSSKGRMWRISYRSGA